MQTTVIFLRHCQTTGQAPDAPLTAKGAEDARRLIPRLIPLGIDAVYASPYLRAVQSIEPFAAKHALPINIDRRLRERRLTAEPCDDWLTHARASFDDFDYRGPGGETLREAQTRGLAALKDIAAESHRCALVASHGNILASLLNSMDSRFAFDDWHAMPNPALYRATLIAGVPAAFATL
jgi:2,3-bisphosphoglycerate-dependent phosphoglycerate mutase